MIYLSHDVMIVHGLLTAVAFQVLDTDGNGQLSYHALFSLFRMVTGPVLTDDQVLELIAGILSRSNLQQDSKVSFEEFTNVRDLIDCEQSLFFFRFSKGSARAREARNEGGSPRRKRETARLARANEIRVGLTTISHLAPSVTRVAICVSRVLLDRLQKKERLLVV